jgi:hypothetical protein
MAGCVFMTVSGLPAQPSVGWCRFAIGRPLDNSRRSYGKRARPKPPNPARILQKGLDARVISSEAESTTSLGVPLLSSIRLISYVHLSAWGYSPGQYWISPMDHLAAIHAPAEFHAVTGSNGVNRYLI